MFSAVLKTIKAGKKSEDTIEFNSSELKENNFVWDFLNSQIELLDGSLREVVIDLHNGRTRTLEFAGGTITVPSNLNCDINLYNHFKEYFQVDYKIPMFLFHGIGDNPSEKYTKVLDHYEVFRKTFKSANQPQVISYFTFGPKLCLGRHSRWRAQFDVFNENATSAVTNHACHSWDESKKIYCNLQGKSENTDFLVVEAGAEKSSLANISMCTSVAELNSNNAIFDLSNANAFNFIVNKVGQLSGNHIISAKKSSKVLKRKQYNELRKFKSDGIVYNPYVLPNDTTEIDFGIWWPTDRETVVLNYVTGDNFDVKEIKLTGNNKVLFRHDFTKADEDLVIWQKYPEKVAGSYDLNQPMLICKNKLSGDEDFTEFQSCWRNQGFESKVFPHWLGNFKAIKPSSRLTGIVNFNLFDAGRLYLQAVKPTQCANVKGKVTVNVFDRYGKEVDTLYSTIKDKKCLSFKFSTGEYGSDIAALRVRSTDIDFTANLLQWNEQGATSLQHLWGY